MSTAVIAFSGGLDTSFLVPFARETYHVDKIVTCAVNTGGFTAEDKARIAARSKEVGADEHRYIEASDDFYNEIIKYLIFGNVTRDGYPLCVGAERLIQAKAALAVAREVEADYFLHGSTGAGNDQYRFDLVAHVMGQAYGSGNRQVELKAPVREFGITRAQSTSFLKKKGVKVEEKTTNYSYNVGLWGVSIGGKETLTSDGLLPDDVWWSQPDPKAQTGELTLTFEKGEPVALTSSFGSARGPVSVVQKAAEIGNLFGIGRHYHIGTSVPGKKGRLGYESPAADIIYEGHRMLERLVMTGLQLGGKKPLSEEFGRLIHEAKFFDPYIEDIKAYLEASQRRVTGTARILLAPGYIRAVTAASPYDLLSLKGATYGEQSDAYTGADAAGAAKLHAFEQKLYHSLDGK